MSGHVSVNIGALIKHMNWLHVGRPPMCAHGGRGGTDEALVPRLLRTARLGYSRAFEDRHETSSCVSMKCPHAFPCETPMRADGGTRGRPTDDQTNFRTQ